MKGRPQRLTAAFVARVREAGRYGDGGRGSHGLSLRVWIRPSGEVARAFCQRVRINGRATNLGLGLVEFTTLREARDQCIDNIRAIRRGEDPRTQVRQAPTVPSFRDAAGKVYEVHAPTWRGAKTARQWQSVMERYVFPVIGTRPVDKVSTADLLRIVEPLWSTKHALASGKLLSWLNKVFMYAMAQGWRADNPAGDTLKAALPKRTGTTKRHHRASHHRDVPDAIATVLATGARPVTKLLFEFVVLTACRTGECREAVWSDVDREARVFTVPPERSKTGKAHRVPLSNRALAVLTEAQELADGSGLLFPSATGKPLADSTLLNLLQRAGVDGTVHGMRSSLRSWCAEQNEPRELAEAALAHAAGAVESAYQRSDMLERRRELMQKWSDYIAPKV